MSSEDKRIKLRDKFREILGNNNTYFNPPESTKLEYPCIVYNLKNMRTRKANNNIYILDNIYTVILIGIKPYDDIKEKILEKIPYCSFDRTYIKDGLYHYAYTIYDNL